MTGSGFYILLLCSQILTEEFDNKIVAECVNSQLLTTAKVSCHLLAHVAVTVSLFCKGNGSCK